MKTVDFYDNIIGCTAYIDGKKISVTKDFLNYLSLEDTVQLLSFGVQRQTMAEILSKVAGNKKAL